MSRRKFLAPAAAVALGLGVFVFYFLAYRSRRLAMPVGFDVPWYVWRADYVASHGLGPLDTAVRPGHPLLSSVLASVTGVSQLRLAVVLPLALVSVFALAVGAFASAGLDAEGWQWAIAVAMTGALLGTTKLVGDYTANLLMLCLAVAAVAALARWVREGPGGGGGALAGAVGLLVAAGIAHWLFLALVLASLLVAAVFAIPASRRQRAAGVSVVRTETGALVAAAGSSALLVLIAVVGVLRTSLNTDLLSDEPQRIRAKLRTDLSRLWLPMTVPVAALGAAVVRSRKVRPNGFALRVLAAWAIVAGAGVVYGVVTLNLPPHRFLALVVVLPFALALTGAVWWLGARVTNWARGSTAAGAAAAAIAVGVLAVPGAVAWYRHGPSVWLDPAALQQVRTAAGYLDGVPAGTPVVFLVGPLGPAGIASVPLKERTVRVGLPSDRQVDAHFFVGEPADLLEGRRTLVSAPIDKVTEPYWNDVSKVLPQRPPVIVLKSLGSKQFDSAVTLGARILAPGVALLQGREPAQPLALETAPRPVPRTMLGLALGGVLLLLLGAAGIGWTRLILGRGAAPEVLWSMAPAVGAASLILGGLLSAKLGVRLGGAGGVATYLIVALSGILAAFWMRDR